MVLKVLFRHLQCGRGDVIFRKMEGFHHYYTQLKKITSGNEIHNWSFVMFVALLALFLVNLDIRINIIRCHNLCSYL